MTDAKKRIEEMDDRQLKEDDDMSILSCRAELSNIIRRHSFMAHSKNFIDITGKKYGRLTVLKEAGTRKWKVYWLCLCECGKTKEINGGALKNGKTKSCGCLRSEVTAKRKTKHGMLYDESGRRRKLYGVWCGMRRRCDNPKNISYKNYGGRGISVCDEWGDYKEFHKWAMRNGYKEGLMIERIDNNGNYCPENCSWETREVQNLNKRNIRYIEYDGELVRIHDLSKERGIDSKAVLNRLRHGWEIDKALSEPVQTRGKKKEG